MNSITDRYRRQRAPSPSQCEPRVQPCSTCGRLECLCRPRFFAGQVLTADDLNRLDYYIRAKHRLHNRQLHGWGVVNGLEASCDACGGGVVVGCGYALSPCGDDIVVCDPVVVDVCALIGECRAGDRDHDCDPPRRPAPSNCAEGEEEWVLAIRYSESPTRAVKPLQSSAAAACGGGCGCGGKSGSCGCASCSGAKPKPRAAPAQCEPTVVCEGYDFAVYRKPAEAPSNDDDGRGLQLNPESELYKRFECCTKALIRDIPKLPGTLTPAAVQQNPVAWYNWLHAFKRHLQKYLGSKPGQNCELLARLDAIVLPQQNSNTFVQQLIEAAVRMFMIWLDALLGCLCSALLPPCPAAHPDDLVPLATVRVTAGSCRVLSICNWTTHRKIATTFPALQYWLSILPFGSALRQMLDDLCCSTISDIELPQDTPGTTDAAGNFGAVAAPDILARVAAAGADTGGAPPYLHERALHRLNPALGQPNRLDGAAAMAASAFMRGSAALDPLAFIESALLPARERGGSHLSDVELANLPQFFALNQMLRPLAFQALLGGEGFAPLSGSMGDDAGDSPGLDELKTEMKKEMAGLREALARQANEIKALKTSGRGRKEK